MGTATLLQIITSVCDELALPSPTVVVGSGDDQMRQLLALANREGKEASKMAGKDYGWTELRKSYTVTLADATQSYALPSDLGYFIPDTVWDVNYKWRLLGPLSPNEWDVIQYGISPVGPRRRFRVYDNLFCINPVPSSSDAGNTIAYEYYSNQWCQSSGGVAQSAWAADTDTYLLDDDAMVLGIIWRFRAAKGLDYERDYDSWNKQISQAIARSGGNRTLPLNAQPQGINLLGPQNVPDTGFGS